MAFIGAHKYGKLLMNAGTDNHHLDVIFNKNNPNGLCASITHNLIRNVLIISEIVVRYCRFVLNMLF